MNKISPIVRIVSALGLVLGLALLVACSATSGSASRPVDADPASSAPVAPPILVLAVPDEGAVVAAGTVTVAVETENLEFVMPSGTNVPGQGHVHFTLDDRPFVMSVEKQAELKDVEAGTHRLVAELVQNDTKSFDPPVRQ